MRTMQCAVLLCAALLLGGCLSRPNLPKESFAFEVPPASLSPTANGPEIGMRRILVASPFDTQPLTYRTGTFSYERDPYAEFLAPPGEILVEPICESLRGTGFFRGVTEPDSSVKPEVEFEVAVLRLYGDFRDRAHP